MPRSRGIFPVAQNSRTRWEFWRDRPMTRFNKRLSRLISTAFILAKVLQLKIWQVVLALFPKLALWLLLHSVPAKINPRRSRP